MPIWRKKNHGDQPEQRAAGKKRVRATGNSTVVDKETDPQGKIIENECQGEILQLEVLRRMRKDPSWNLAIETLLLCENNPSDAELIATSVHRNKKKGAS